MRQVPPRKKALARTTKTAIPMRKVNSIKYFVKKDIFLREIYEISALQQLVKKY